jgi:hypothetical protein
VAKLPPNSRTPVPGKALEKLKKKLTRKKLRKVFSSTGK